MITNSIVKNTTKSQETMQKVKQADKYKQYIEDAFDVWDDLINGFRFKPKFFIPEEDEKPKDEKNNSRNPKKSRSTFQKTVRIGNKAGFGSSSTRLNLPSKRGNSKIDIPKPNSLSDAGMK